MVRPFRPTPSRGSRVPHAFDLHGNIIEEEGKHATFLTHSLVAVATLVVPLAALAGNQEVADYITANLGEQRAIGPLPHFGANFQDGTAILQGEVNSQEEMRRAVKICP